MLSEERKLKILNYINTKHAVTATDLMEKFNASEATIRRDLTEMDKKGLISKVHGGAASLISANDTVFLDAGTTTSYLIDYLEAANVTFVTNAIVHAQKLAAKGYSVYLTGGKLKSTTEALVGVDCYAFLSNYHFSIGFFGTNAVNEETGFTTPDPEEAKIKQCALSHTMSPYVLCDHSKFDMTAPVSFASYEQACIITAGDVPKKYRKEKNVIYLTDFN